MNRFVLTSIKTNKFLCHFHAFITQLAFFLTTKEDKGPGGTYLSQKMPELILWPQGATCMPMHHAQTHTQHYKTYTNSLFSRFMECPMHFKLTPNIIKPTQSFFSPVSWSEPCILHPWEREREMLSLLYLTKKSKITQKMQLQYSPIYFNLKCTTPLLILKTTITAPFSLTSPGLL